MSVYVIILIDAKHKKTSRSKFAFFLEDEQAFMLGKDDRRRSLNRMEEDVLDALGNRRFSDIFLQEGIFSVDDHEELSTKSSTAEYARGVFDKLYQSVSENQRTFSVLIEELKRGDNKDLAHELCRKCEEMDTSDGKDTNIKFLYKV